MAKSTLDFVTFFKIWKNCLGLVFLGKKLFSSYLDLASTIFRWYVLQYSLYSAGWQFVLLFLNSFYFLFLIFKVGGILGWVWVDIFEVGTCIKVKLFKQFLNHIHISSMSWELEKKRFQSIKARFIRAVSQSAFFNWWTTGFLFSLARGVFILLYYFYFIIFFIFLFFIFLSIDPFSKRTWNSHGTKLEVGSKLTSFLFILFVLNTF